MTNPKDRFRKPKKNPEIKFLVQMVKKKTREIALETDYLARKGHARILIAHLEALDDEPEFLYDLTEGSIEAPGAYFRADEFEEGKVAFKDEGPFDKDGETEGDYFFYTGRISKLIDGDPVDPYQLYKPFHRILYWNFSVEKVYGSANPTTMHVSDESVFEKALGRRKLPVPEQGKWAYLVLADPCGLKTGKQAYRVTHTSDLKKAIGIADKLGELLDIRFVVAKVVHAFLNR